MLCAGLAACQDGGTEPSQAANEPVYQIFPNPDDPNSPPVYVPASQLGAYYDGEGSQPAADGSYGYDDSQQQAYQQEMMRQQQLRAQQEQQQWFQQNYGQ
jgi:hypothetical protein